MADMPCSSRPGGVRLIPANSDSQFVPSLHNQEAYYLISIVHFQMLAQLWEIF